MAKYLESFSLFPLLLTFGAYQVGLWCQKKGKSPLFNPILIAVLLVIAVVLIFGIDPVVYQAGTAGISWLLTPATVCLALPLYQQIKLLKKNLWAVLAGIAAGTVTSLAFILLMCLVFRLDATLSVSLLPKSITTAMGLALSGQAEGIPSLTAAAILITGILGNLTGSMLCKLFRIHDPVAQGVAFGTASHVVGTARATELGEIQSAVSSFSLAVSGLLTAVLFPLACMLL